MFLLGALCLILVAQSQADTDVFKPDSSDTSSTASRDWLIHDLFQTYKKVSYPEGATVQFGITLLSAELDDDRDRLNSEGWLQYMWKDSRLAWDSDKYGVKTLRLPSDYIWLPDTRVYNGMGFECTPTNVILYSSGDVIWVPPCTFQTYCNITLTNDQPRNKEHECELKFGSWTYDGITMGFDFFNGKQAVDVSYFASQKFKVTQNVGILEKKTYPCCVEPYFDIKYTLGFTKVED